MRDKTYDNRGTPREEIILIRIGHHLWALSKRARHQDSALSAALETVWNAKRVLRGELREKYRQSAEKSKMNLSAKSRFKERATISLETQDE